LCPEKIPLKKKQYISWLFLLSISILLAHGIVPHHHHPEPYLSDCQSESGNQDCPDQAPWRCHVINQLLFVDYHVFSKQHILKLFRFDGLLESDRQKMAKPETDTERVITSCCHFRQISLILHSPLRAPPVSA
jgi:hypothetical protein